MSKTRHCWIPTAFLVVAIAPALWAAEHSYDPLDPGRTWTYKLSTGETERTLEVRILPPRELAGLEVSVKAEVVDGQEFLTFRSHSEGRVCTVAFQYPWKKTPTFLDPRPCTPDTWIDEGAAWRQWIQQEMPPHGAVSIPVKVETRATDAVVAVAAGRFANCVRVHSHGSVALDATGDTHSGVTVDSTVWSAPGVGVVKSVFTRAETHTGQEVTVTAELVDWEQ